MGPRRGKSREYAFECLRHNTLRRKESREPKNKVGKRDLEHAAIGQQTAARIAFFWVVLGKEWEEMRGKEQ